MISTLLLILFTHTVHASGHDELQRMRESLPEKALTVDLVVARAMKTSNGFKQVQAEAYKIPAPQWQAESAFDTRLEITQGWLRNDNESSHSQSPNSTHGDATSIAVSRYFSTGTGVKLEASQGYNDIGFPSGSFINIAPYHETKTGLSLEQKLWADSFGYASRRALRAARLASDAQNYNFQNSMEQWTLGIVDSFYLAWYSQSQALAARAGMKRKERLLESTKLRLARGTAETPDYLQVESAFLLSRAQKLEAEKNLDDQWRRLIILLKLPSEWLEIDAVDVPLKIDDVATKGLSICQNFRKKGIPQTETSQIMGTQKMYESAELNLEKAENERWPDLKLTGRYFTNGIATQAGSSGEEAIQRDNPGWAVGLTLSLPLEFSMQKANISQAKAEKIRLEATKNNTKDNHTLDWLNECANLERLDATIKDADKAYRNQVKRADLEERRFRLGRSNTLNVIQAGDDATQAEVFLRATEVQLRQSAWRVLNLDSKVVLELRSFAQKHGSDLKLDL